MSDRGSASDTASTLTRNITVLAMAAAAAEKQLGPDYKHRCTCNRTAVFDHVPSGDTVFLNLDTGYRTKLYRGGATEDTDEKLVDVSKADERPEPEAPVLPAGRSG